MRSFLDSRLKISLSVALVAVLVVLGVMALKSNEHSPKSISQHLSTSPSSSPTASPSLTRTTTAYVVNDYPPSRFQAGRPSLVNGLAVVSGDGSKRTLTMSWNPSPSSENVDEYAIYYHNFVPTPPSRTGSGILAAVVKSTSITLSIVEQDQSSPGSSPYGLAQVPICVDQSDCLVTPFDNQYPYQVMVWVIAHNNFGWGNNDPDTPNPDENPNNFAELSKSQSDFQKAATPIWYSAKSYDLRTIDPQFATGAWPQPPTTQYSASSASNPLDNTPWTVPWLPNVELPTSRFGPDRPSNIKELKATVDLTTGTIDFVWSPSPSSEQVDRYAIYVAYHHNWDDAWITNAVLVSVQSTNRFSSYLNIDGLTPNKKKKLAGASTYFTDQPYSAQFWVIAHNKNGWGDNDPDTANPDQSANDLRPLTIQESAALHAPSSVLGVGLPCKLSDAKSNNCLVDPQSTYSY